MHSECETGQWYMQHGDIEASEPQMISNFLAKFFVQLYTTQTVANIVSYPYEIENYEVFSYIKFLYAEVFNGLRRLKFFGIFNADGTAGSVPVKCSVIVVKSIVEIFNLCDFVFSGISGNVVNLT